MEDLLKQIKQSPEYAAIASKLSDSQIRDFLQQYSKSTEGQMDSEGGVMITPNKGYVVKTFDMNTKEKVFVNVCGHEIIDLPEEKDMPEIEDHLALRVPLSLGNPRPDHDKGNHYIAGKICTIYDVVVNPAILDKSSEDSTTRQLLIELIVTHVGQKFKQQLSLSIFYIEYRLPKLKYKGTLQQQRVRGKKDPKIQVIDKEVFQTPVESTRMPAWKLSVDGEDMDIENIKTCKEFILIVELELLISGKGISLKASKERVEINVGKIYFLGLWMPFMIDVQSLVANFDCKERKLVVKGKKVVEEVEEEKSTVKLKPVDLSENDLLFDIV